MSVNLTQYNRKHAADLAHAVSKAERMIAEYKACPPPCCNNGTFNMHWTAEISPIVKLQKHHVERLHTMICSVLYSSGFYANIDSKKGAANEFRCHLQMVEMTPEDKLENLAERHPCGCIGEFHSCAASAKQEEEFQKSRGMD
jgi:hypothetical protein